MAEGEQTSLSPIFADIGQQLIDAKQRALGNLMDIEGRIERIQQDAGAVALEGAAVEHSIPVVLESARLQATFDFDILSAMARPYETLSEGGYNGFSDLDPSTANHKGEAQSDTPQPSPDDTKPPSGGKPENSTHEEIADRLLTLIIDEGGSFNREESLSAAGRARGVLDLTYYQWIGARKFLESRGFLTFVPISEDSGLLEEIVLEEEALAEAARQGELSQEILDAIREQVMPLEGSEAEAAPIDAEPAPATSANRQPASEEEIESEVPPVEGGEEEAAEEEGDPEPGANQDAEIEENGSVEEVEEPETETGSEPEAEEDTEVEEEVKDPAEEVAAPVEEPLPADSGQTAESNGTEEATAEESEVDEEALLEDFEQALAEDRARVSGRDTAATKRKGRRRTTTREAARDQEERQEAKRVIQKEGRTMNFYVPYEGGLFSARMSAKKFKEQPASDRLILAVTLVRSAKFADVFNTEKKITDYLVRVVNKGIDKDDEKYLDEQKLQKLIDETIETGKLSMNKIGPEITEEGLTYLQAQKKDKHWW